MFQIIAIVIGVIALGIAIIGAVVGALIGLKRSLASLLAVLAAAVCAVLLTFSLCSPTSDLMQMGIGYIEEGVGSLGEEIASIFAIEELGSALAYYVSMIAAPFFFTVVFAVLWVVIAAVLITAFSFIPILLYAPEVGSILTYHLGGAGIGLLCGLLIAVACLFPIVGVLDIAESVVAKVPDETIEKLGLDETLESLPFDLKSEQKYMQYFDYVGFGKLYDVFASVTVEDEKVYFKEEADVIGDIAISVLSIDFGAKQINDGHVQAAKDVVADLDRSALLRDTVAGVISGATGEGGLISSDTLGVDEVIMPLVDELLNVVSTTDKNNLTADLTTLVNVLDIMVKNNILNMSDYKALLSKLGDGVIGELLVELTKNERMQPVADEITILSIRVLANELGVPSDNAERYDLLMNEIAYVLSSGQNMTAEDRRDKAISDLGPVFDNYGMTIEGLALENIVDGLLADLGDKESVTGSDVKEFFLIYGVAKSDAREEAAKGSAIAVLSDVDSSFAVGNDGTISVNGVILVNYNFANYRNSYAYIMGHDGVDIGNASSLTSAETMISTLLTSQKIINDLGHYSDCEDVAAECEKVGEVFGEMISVLDDIDLDEFDAAVMISGMGHVLDLMKYSEIFGEDAARDIITMVLQSETVMDSLGLKRSDMTNFANKINSYAEGKEKGYEEATVTISNTINAITKATDKNASTEEKTGATAELINNINKDNAEMISSMITGDMIGNFGSVAENTETVSNSLKSLIDNMANYKEGNPDEASVNKEAEAVTTILSLAIVGSNNDSMFDKKDEHGNVIERGSVGSDPDSFIATVVESEVVMGTVGDTVKDGESNPYGVTYNSEDEKQEVTEALENYYVENATGDDEELKSKLQDLAIVMDVEIDLDQFAD